MKPYEQYDAAAGLTYFGACSSGGVEVSYSTFAGPVCSSSVEAVASYDWLECTYCGTQQRYQSSGECRSCGAGRQHSRLPKQLLHR